jgi:hypothetical protein
MGLANNPGCRSGVVRAARLPGRGTPRCHIVFLRTRTFTGWLEATDEGSAVYAPHTSKGSGRRHRSTCCWSPTGCSPRSGCGRRIDKGCRLRITASPGKASTSPSRVIRCAAAAHGGAVRVLRCQRRRRPPRRPHDHVTGASRRRALRTGFIFAAEGRCPMRPSGQPSLAPPSAARLLGQPARQRLGRRTGNRPDDHARYLAGNGRHA